MSEATLEATTDGILVVDRKGRIQRFNRRFVELWRIPKRIVDARDDEAALAFVLHQLKDPDAFLERVRALYASPKAESFDTIEFKDGSFFERYSRPYWMGRKVVGRVWSFRDVTLRRRLERGLAEAAGHEQARIGRELHDSVGQTITALSLLARAAAAKLSKGSKGRADLSRIEVLSRTALQQMRAISRGLLPLELGSGDFETALHSLAEEARELFGVRCAISVRGETRLHDRAAAFELYRIAQEAVINAAKHARVQKGIRVLFAGGAKRLRLVVSDDGIGLPKRLSGTGLGLAIMRHRARLLGGALELHRGAKGGTQVVCECPRSPAARA